MYLFIYLNHCFTAHSCAAMLPLQGLHGLFKNRAILVTPSLLVYILDLLFGEWKFSSFVLTVVIILD